jgi:hypothetical protein
MKFQFLNTEERVDDNNKKYVNYLVQITNDGYSWNVNKRYNDFLRFHEIILRKIRNTGAVAQQLKNFQFPSKSCCIFINQEQLINQRIEGFKNYLDIISCIPSLSSDMFRFLDAVDVVVSEDDDVTN